MEIKTADTYEASWYLMNGAVLKEIEFGKIQENKWSKKGYTKLYKMILTDVQPRLVDYWKSHRPTGNVRRFSEVRQHLKRKIQKLERKREKY